MRLAASVMLAVSCWAILCVAQDDSTKLRVSKEALTPEQLAVYRVVLNNFMKDSHGALNLSNRTYPLDLAGPFFDKGCVNGIKLEETDNSVRVVHMFSSTTTLVPNVLLVDPKRQEAKVKQNDPQNLMKKAIDEREPVTGEQLDKSLELAFSTGLSSLSEIIFDKGHHHAIVSYSFVCGSLCGHGNTLIIEKTGDTWKVVKTCASWIS
jgi:hypothetical protein